MENGTTKNLGPNRSIYINTYSDKWSSAAPIMAWMGSEFKGKCQIQSIGARILQVISR